MPNVLSPRGLVFRPDNMDKTVLSSTNVQITPRIHAVRSADFLVAFQIVQDKGLENSHTSASDLI